MVGSRFKLVIIEFTYNEKNKINGHRNMSGSGDQRDCGSGTVTMSGGVEEVTCKHTTVNTHPAMPKINPRDWSMEA